MNLFHLIVQRFMCGIALLGGLLLVFSWIPGVGAVAQFVSNLFEPPTGFLSLFLQLIVGLPLTVFAVMGLLPADGIGRGRKRIIVPGAHGRVAIQLRSVEESLNRMASMLPEVNYIRVQVYPSKDSRRAAIRGEVYLRTSSQGSAAETANRVSDTLANTALNILGIEEVTDISLDVRSIIIDGDESRLMNEALPSDEEEEGTSGEEQTPGLAESPPSEYAGEASEPEWETPPTVLEEALPVEEDEEDASDAFHPAREAELRHELEDEQDDEAGARGENSGSTQSPAEPPPDEDESKD
ncbi:MAG: hypothetical protein R6W89_06130 [Candidatus Hydrogenedentota bacterium]